MVLFLSALAPAADDVQKDGEDDDGADDGALPEGGVLLDDQVDAVEDNVQDGGSQDGAEKRALATCQAAATDHRGGDGVELVAVAAAGIALAVVADVSTPARPASRALRP